MTEPFVADITRRISALLDKADRTENAFEAEAYVLKAQELATIASINIAAARMRTPEQRDPITRTIIIGEKGRRANQHLIALFVAVAHANSAQVDVASDSTYVIGYGMPGDLDMVEAVFAAISVQMVASATTYIGSGVWREESYLVRGARSSRKSFTAQTARAAFYRAYVERIGERLQQARQEGIDHSDRDRGETPGAGALVLRDSERKVREFHCRTSQARGAWRGYSGGARPSGSAGAQGRAAASRARLAALRELPGSRGRLGPGGDGRARPTQK
jgi:hypothetical protein